MRYRNESASLTDRNEWRIISKGISHRHASTIFLMGPVAAILADLGAAVIAVEPIRGKGRFPKQSGAAPTGASTARTMLQLTGQRHKRSFRAQPEKSRGNRDRSKLVAGGISSPENYRSCVMA